MSAFRDLRISLRELKSVETESGRLYSVPGCHSEPVTGWYDYPSITTILGNNPEKKRALSEWRARVGAEKAAQISARASSRGTAVHDAMEKYVLGEDAEESTNPVRRAAVRNLREVLDANLDGYYGVECPLYSHALRVAGRCDLVGIWAGRRAVIDYKTSNHEKDEDDILDYFLQTTAYSVMFEERTGLHIPGIVVLIACDSGMVQMFMKPTAQYVPKLIKTLEERRPSWSEQW